MTKQQTAWYRAYLNSHMTQLYHCYDSFSTAKQNAFIWCLRRCGEMHGSNPRIISYNTFGFSMAWEYMNPETGEIMLHVETPRNTYEFSISNID